MKAHDKSEFESEAPSGRELSAKQTEGELRNIKQLQTLRYAILLPSFCDAKASQKSTSLPEGGLVNSPINPNLTLRLICATMIL